MLGAGVFFIGVDADPETENIFRSVPKHSMLAAHAVKTDVGMPSELRHYAGQEDEFGSDFGGVDDPTSIILYWGHR